MVKSIQKKIRVVSEQIGKLQAKITVKRVRLAALRKQLMREQARGGQSSTSSSPSSPSSSDAEEQSAGALCDVQIGTPLALEDARADAAPHLLGAEADAPNAVPPHPDNVAVDPVDSALLPPPGAETAAPTRPTPTLPLRSLPDEYYPADVKCRRCKRWLKGLPGGPAHTFCDGCFGKEGRRIPTSYRPRAI